MLVARQGCWLPGKDVGCQARMLVARQGCWFPGKDVGCSMGVLRRYITLSLPRPLTINVNEGEKRHKKSQGTF